MVVAYLRVSTEKQHLANQRDEIERFATNHNLVVNRWVTEIVSGRKNRSERRLGEMLKKLHEGDVLIITELSRLSRTLTDIMSIMGFCLERKIILYSTKDGYAFDDSINSKVLCFAFGLVAEIERNLISLRTKEALALRRADGIKLGRRKGSFTKLQRLIDSREEVIERIHDGMSIKQICYDYEVSPDTFHRFRKMDAAVAAALLKRIGESYVSI